MRVQSPSSFVRQLPSGVGPTSDVNRLYEAAPLEIAKQVQEVGLEQDL